MENELITPLEDNEESTEEEKGTIPASVIHRLAPYLNDLPYDDAIGELTKYYDTLDWEDKDQAAREYATAVDRFNHLHKVTPDTGLTESFTGTVKGILNPNISDDDKLLMIDEKFEELDAATYADTSNTDALRAAKQREKELEALKLTFRRSVISKDTGWLTDKLARGVNNALSPLAGGADMVLDTDLKQGLREATMEITKPEWDEDISSMVASGFGSVAGAGVSGLVGGAPGLYGYLGLQMVSETMEVHDTVLKETGDKDAAESAAAESVPGSLLGAFGDRLTGGWAVKILGGKGIGLKTGKAALLGSATEGLTETGQEIIANKALVKYTDNPLYNATELELFKVFVASSIVGGTVGGVGGLRTAQLAKAEEIKAAIINNEPVEIGGEKVENPQGFLRSMGQKFARFQILKKKAEDEGKTVEEVMAEEKVSKPGMIFQDIAERLMEDESVVPPLDEIADIVAQEEVTAEGMPAKKKEKETKSPVLFSPDFGFAQPAAKDAASYAYGNYVANEMGVELSVKVMKDALGAYGRATTDTPGEVSFIRELFRNSGAFIKVFWHEFSHAIDSAAGVADGLITDPITDKTLEPWRKTPAFDKFVRIRQDFEALGLEEDRESFTAEVDALDMAYRPYTKKAGSKDTEYRTRGTEQFANAMSALLTDPEMVRDNYPTVWRTFKKAVDAHPRLKEITNMIERAKDDPTVLAEIYTELKEVGQNAEGKIVKEAKEKEFDEKKAKFLALPREAAKGIRLSLWNRFGKAWGSKEAIVESGFMSKEEFHKNYRLTQATSRAYREMESIIDKPIKEVIDTLKANTQDANDIVIRNFANFMDILHIKNDTNETLDEIQTNPEDYKKAAALIGETLELPGWGARTVGLEGEDLVQKLSSMLIELESESKAELKKELLSQMAEASTHINEGTAEDASALTEKYFNNYFAVKLLEDDAFSVRRLMPNYAIDGGSAEALLDSMKRRVGFDPEHNTEGDWQHYDKAIKGMHKLGHRMINDMETAGLLDRKTGDKLRRNVESYAPQNVIRYFEKNPRIPASIRKAYGSLDVTGNSLTSYISKMKALMFRAAFQQTQNSAANIARAAMPRDSYREITPKKRISTKKGKPKVYYDSVFDTKTLLEAKNKDKSYFITAKDGNMTLLEFDSPDWGKMFSEDNFAKGHIAPAFVAFVDGYNKATLAHATKTMYSIPFRWTQRIYDIKKEALLAGSWEMNLFPFKHSSKQLNRMRKAARADLKAKRDRGEVSPELQEAELFNAVPSIITEEYGGMTEKEQVQNKIYEELGQEVPGLEDKPTWYGLPSWMNRKGIKILEKIPFIKDNKEAIKLDEEVAKYMGWKISREILGKGPEESAYISRNWTGTPDPAISGKEMGSINHVFMFQRAGLGGVRALTEMAKDDPLKFGMQFTYRALLPAMMLSGDVMGPIVGAVFGDDSEKIYRRFCEKLPSYLKTNKTVIGLGFKDAEGRFRPFTDVRPDEINASWKSVAITVPQERAFVSVNQAIRPFMNFFEDLLATGKISGKQIAEDARTAFSQILGSNVSPGTQFAWHMGVSEVFGAPSIWSGNPKDYFRNKGVISKDVAAANDMYKKFAEYAQWSLYNMYPSMFGLIQPNKKSELEPTSFYDSIAKAPQVGKLLTAFTTVTNYGDIEGTRGDKGARAQLDASLRLSMGPTTRALIDEASRMSGIMSGYGQAGKKWKEEVDPLVKDKIKRVNKWRPKYNEALKELRIARTSGDIEAEQQIMAELEEDSTYAWADLNAD